MDPPNLALHWRGGTENPIILDLDGFHLDTLRVKVKNDIGGLARGYTKLMGLSCLRRPALKRHGQRVMADGKGTRGKTLTPPPHETVRRPALGKNGPVGPLITHDATASAPFEAKRRLSTRLKREGG